MAEERIDIGNNQHLQGWENARPGGPAITEATTPVDINGDPINFGAGAVTPKSVAASAAGANLIVTPSAGKAVRLWWYNIGAHPSNGAHVVAGLRFTASGVDFFNTALSQYGASASHSFKAGKSYHQGGADESLYVNLSTAQTVFCNIDYEEVTP